jgi:hypothetical protein
MKRSELLKLLADIHADTLSPAKAAEQLKQPFEDIGFAKVDHHRVAAGIRRSDLRQRQDARANFRMSS